MNWLTRPQTKSMMSPKSIGVDLEARGKRTYGAAEYGYEYEFDYIDMMRDNP